MQSIDLETVASLVDGAVDIRWRNGSIQPIRVPVPELPLYDDFTRFVATLPAGLRLRFRSTTTCVRLEFTQRRTEIGELRPAPFDLFIDGVRVARQPAEGGALVDANGRMSGDERASLLIERLPAGNKAIELFFPQFASIVVTGMAIDDQASLAPDPDERRRIVFHGSSITHCAEAAGPSDTWPAVASRAANLRHLNLGWAGSCLLSGLAARIIRDQPADSIVLKLGINVHGDGQLKARTFRDSAHSMIATIRERHRTTPLALVSPIFSASREDAGSAGGPSLNEMRAILEDVAATWRERMGDRAIHYLSGLDLFGPADAPDLPDDLHPNAAGYIRMGERFHAAMLAPGRPLAPAAE